MRSPASKIPTLLFFFYLFRFSSPRAPVVLPLRAYTHTRGDDHFDRFMLTRAEAAPREESLAISLINTCGREEAYAAQSGSLTFR